MTKAVQSRVDKQEVPLCCLQDLFSRSAKRHHALGDPPHRYHGSSKACLITDTSPSHVPEPVGGGGGVGSCSLFLVRPICMQVHSLLVLPM